MRKENLIPILALSLVAGATVLDIRNDLAQGAEPAHLYSEGIVAVVALLLLVWLLLSLRSQGRHLTQLKTELDAARAESARAGPEAIEARQCMSGLIRRQFQQWQLTPSEQEVALLMLKGLSFREIAALRNTLEKTVRQQASTIYRKADLPGRHALAAWFIEDYL